MKSSSWVTLRTYINLMAERDEIRWHLGQNYLFDDKNRDKMQQRLTIINERISEIDKSDPVIKRMIEAEMEESK